MNKVIRIKIEGYEAELAKEFIMDTMLAHMPTVKVIFEDPKPFDMMMAGLNDAIEFANGNTEGSVPPRANDGMANVPDCKSEVSKE